MFDSKASVVEKYDPITLDCVQERRIMDGREISSDQGYKAAIVVNNDLYVVSSNKVEKFNSLALSWEKLAKGEERTVLIEQKELFGVSKIPSLYAVAFCCQRKNGVARPSRKQFRTR